MTLHAQGHAPTSKPRGSLGLAPWTTDLAHRHDRRWGLAAARRYCWQLLRSRNPNAAAWLSLFGERRASVLCTLAAFARIVDDLADEEEFSAVREAQLEALSQALEEARSGRVEHPVLVALVDVERAYDLDPATLDGLLAAAEREVREPEVADWADLQERGMAQAAPLGRTVLRVLGRDRPELDHWADELCVGLYLTTRLQNLSQDLARGRVALPADECTQLGITRQDLFSGRALEPIGVLVHRLAERTRWLYRSAYPLVVEVGLPGAIPLAGLWLGGRSVLRMVDRAGARLVRSRPTVGPMTLAWALAGAGLERLPAVME